MVVPPLAAVLLRCSSASSESVDGSARGMVAGPPWCGPYAGPVALSCSYEPPNAYRQQYGRRSCAADAAASTDRLNRLCSIGLLAVVCAQQGPAASARWQQLAPRHAKHQHEGVASTTPAKIWRRSQQPAGGAGWCGGRARIEEP
jgi:hypothetical protein